jgi:hypothetical protein
VDTPPLAYLILSLSFSLGMSGDKARANILFPWSPVGKERASDPVLALEM